MRLPVLAALPVLLLACSTFGTDGAGGGGAGGDADGGQKAVDGTPAEEALLFNALPKTPLFVTQGASVTVPLNIARGRNVLDPITVTVEDLPTGVAPALLQFGIGEAKAQLVIQAAGDAAQGPIHAKVRATSGKITTTTALELFVRGAPGSLDTTFGDKGFVANFGGDAKCYGAVALRVMSDDRLLVVGSVPSTCIARLSSEGQWDSGYGTAGVAFPRTDYSPAQAHDDSATDAILLGNGKVVFIATHRDFDTLKDNIALKRVNANGSVDTTFGTNGVCNVSPSVGAFNRTTGLAARESDGAIFAQFHHLNGAQRSIGLLKVGGNCEAASEFGTSGTATVSWSTDTVAQGILMRGEKPVSIGVSAVDPARWGIGQVDGNTGAPDPTFGAAGQKFWPASSRPTSAFPEPSGAILLPSGAIAANLRLAEGFVVASIEPGGNALSASFGSGGVVTVTTTGRPTDVARQSDGKLLVNVFVPGTGIGADVRRLNADGSPDGAFGKAGTFGDLRFRSKRVGIQRDGRIIVMGDATTSSTSNINLVRIWN